MKILNGIAGSPGIAKGVSVFYNKQNNTEITRSIDEALKIAICNVDNLYNKALKELGEDKAKIFSAYKMLLEDDVLINQIKSEIKNGVNAAKATLDITGKMSSILASKKNEYMRQRADDIRYVGQLISDCLYDNKEFVFPDGEEKVIVVAYELTPVDTMLFNSKRLAGLVTQMGGATSHTVILAKSLGIPSIVGVCDIEKNFEEGFSYIDGYTGTLCLNPDTENKAFYDKKAKDELKFLEIIDLQKNIDTKTSDNQRINLSINIGNPSDLDGCDDTKFDGIGLFRSEFLYSSTSTKPTLEQQIFAYKKVIDAVYPNSVTIRTLDAGGDKEIKYLGMKKEENPFLGSRGIRLCLSNKEIFSEQLKAILIAGYQRKVKIMLPMITCISEISDTKEIISNLKKQLDIENIPYCTDISVGIMIETPASAIMAFEFSKHCDFFSIGTNDLVQYIMAADRGNSDVKSLYNPYHPAVIRMIYNVIKAGEESNIEVSICGDLAANTDFTSLFLGMGLKKFSVPFPMVGRIKYKIAQTKMSDARHIANKAMQACDSEQVIDILKKER